MWRISVRSKLLQTFRPKQNWQHFTDPPSVGNISWTSSQGSNWRYVTSGLTNGLEPMMRHGISSIPIPWWYLQAYSASILIIVENYRIYYILCTYDKILMYCSKTFWIWNWIWNSCNIFGHIIVNICGNKHAFVIVIFFVIVIVIDIAITPNKYDQALWRHMASLGHNELPKT